MEKNESPLGRCPFSLIVTSLLLGNFFHETRKIYIYGLIVSKLRWGPINIPVDVLRK